MRRGFFTAVSAAFAGLVLAGFASAAPAAAAPAGQADIGDVVTSMKIGYTVKSDGVLHVDETIAYHFGSTGRHGIFRNLITREKYRGDESKDQKYEISNIAVTSPSGASDEFTTKTTKSNGQRDQSIQIKIGSADETISGTEATYVISYDVRGALRHFKDHSELYWDATGTGWEAVLRSVTVTVNVPQGVQQVDCFVGPPGSTENCPQKSVVGGNAVFGAANLDRHEQLTIVAGIKPGVVSNDTPIVVDPPSWLDRLGLTLPGVIGSGAVTVGAIVAAVVYTKKGNRDQRFAGMPPGTFPPSGMNAQPVKDDLEEDQIPVAFSPPRIPVAEGGLLIDAKATTTETAATLIDLAVRGGIRIDNTGNEQKAVLLNPAVATLPHEQVLLQGLFPSLQPGAEITLERRPVGDTSMRQAHDAMIAALREQIKQRQWYLRMPRAGGGSAVSGGARVACFGILATWIFGAGIGGTAIGAATGGLGRALSVAIPVLAVIVAIGIWIGKRGQGQRNPAGRAVTDQLIGFRTYLATAEADQLKFEEGEDIFSKYLPWAIAFELADRWQRVCAQLVAAGRIPPDPYWYVGPSYYNSGFAAGSISQTVASTFDPPPAPAGSGGGGGSSSGFSGGSSGGGGGGGGGGSW
ncbi:putative membrane protein DUF2207 [Kribbella voronezhensis]|uniref:Putative membrane protein DUF2207 n=1 Tax=Kribbella voronezhensis TaxID=2512212 RepID=A0A4R7SYS2_9ACTN|nr:DUF2207 domain-containing protein [Kribbella voronezhensis]TDU84481.1 putative membrane protein DUF2207 [Kribbella voronezhensis]